jgi:hypothetical protein
MKNYLLLVVSCLLLTSPVFAQKYPLGKGAVRSGGGFNFTQVDDPEGKIYRFTVNPNAGYFLTDDFMLGFAMNYTGSIAPGSYSSTIRFSPQARYYFPLNESFFLLADAYYNLDKQRKVINSITELEDNSSFSFGPGVDYFLTRRVSCELVLLYTAYVQPDDTEFNKWSLNFGFNVRLPIKKRDRLEEFNPYPEPTPDIQLPDEAPVLLPDQRF